jgi:hypothetical protein
MTTGTGGSGMTTGTGGSGMTTGTGGMGGADTSGTGGSGMTGGSGGTMVDPRCAAMDGMISWWHADNDYDDAVGSNDGNTAGAVSFVPGVQNQGFGFNGTTGSFVDVPNDASLSPATEITIDAWINTSVFGGRIVDKITAFFSDGYLLDLAGDQVRMIVGQETLNSATPVPAGMFTHVAGVFGPDTGGSGFFKMSVYINGVLAGEKLTGQSFIPANGLSMRVGADSNGGSLFNGVIDEPRIWSRALSATEIQTLFWQNANCPH